MHSLSNMILFQPKAYFRGADSSTSSAHENLTMDKMKTAKDETARRMFEYVHDRTNDNPTAMDVLSSYEILMYQVCSYAMIDMLKSLLNKLDNITLTQSGRHTVTSEDYRSCLLYDCLAVALKKKQTEVVQVLLAVVTQNQRYSTLTNSLTSKLPYTLLHCAAANGDVNIIFLLISSGCDVNQINNKGETALHFASDANTAAILLDHGADVNGMQIRHTPLYYACASSRFGVVNKLLDWGARTNLGSPKLYEACKLHVDSKIASILPVFKSKVARLKISGGCLLGFRNFIGRVQPLCFTCKQENQLLVEKLRQNASVMINQNDSQLARAIWELFEKKTATGTEDIEKIQLILSESELSIVNIIDESGTTPLYVAVERNLIEVTKLLIACGAKPNLTTSGKYPLVVACKCLSHEFVRILLAGGADPNVVDFQGESPLCLAASSFDHRLVELLVEHGADVNLQDKGKRTAFYAVIEQMCRQQSRHSCLSAAAECIQLATYLIDNGSNLDHTRIDNGKTALNLLIEFAFGPFSTGRFFRRSLCFQLFDLLLERGADVRKGLQQKSPMYVATTLNSPYVVQELLRFGGNANYTINVNHTNRSDCESVLNVACCWNESTLIARILLVAGADTKSINWNELSLLTKNYDLIELILNYGAIINIPNNVVLVTSYRKHNGSWQIQPLRFEKCNDNAAQNRELSDFFVTRCKKNAGLTRLFKSGCSLKFLADCCRGKRKRITNTRCAQLAGRLCQAIALVEYNVKHQQLVTLLKQSGRPKDNDLASWFDENSMTPPSLLCLSRSAARRQLSAASGCQTILPLIDVLEIPIKMRMYLKFEGPWSEVDFAVFDDVTSNDACSCK